MTPQKQFKLNKTEALQLAEYYHFEVKDFRKAYEWYIRSASLGSHEAQAIAGEMLVSGELGEPDPLSAVRLWKPSACAGNMDAAVSLGHSYFYGEGVAKNIDTAIDYYKTAANQGHKIACYNLGLMYYYGDGVVPNTRISKKYLNKSYKLGYKKAGSFLRKWDQK